MADITIIDLAPAVAAAGLSILEQKAFFKIACDGKALYPNRAKRRITRMDIAGFRVDHPAVRPPAKKNGNVTGQIDMTHPEAWDAIRLAFEGLVDGLGGCKPEPTAWAKRGHGLHL